MAFLARVALFGMMMSSALAQSSCPEGDETCKFDDEVSMLQLRADVSRQNSSEESDEGSKYNMFKVGGEPKSIKVAVTCPERKRGALNYNLVNPFLGGRSGVPYHVKEDANVLLKFPRSKKIEDTFDDEITLYMAYKGLVPKTKECSGTVLEIVDSKGAKRVLSGADQRTHTFAIIIKDIIKGYAGDKVLMTLCDKNKGARGPPKNCKAGNHFNAVDYRGVKSMMDKKWGSSNRGPIGKAVMKDLQCLIGHFVMRCVDTGVVTGDLKPANFVYGKLHGKGETKLWLVDAALHATGRQFVPPGPKRQTDCGPKIMDNMFTGGIFNFWVKFCTGCDYFPPNKQPFPTETTAAGYIGWTRPHGAGGFCPANL